MDQFEVSKPVGIAIATVAALLLGVGVWFATGRQQGDPTKPSMTGVPAVAGPATAPMDASGGIPPSGAGAAAMAAPPGSTR